MCIFQIYSRFISLFLLLFYTAVVEQRCVRKGFDTISSTFNSSDSNKLCSVNNFRQFSQKTNEWVLHQNTLMFQKEHFVLAGIVILKAVETTPFSGTVISISRTNEAAKQSKKYYPGCPFIRRSISTDMNIVCIDKIIFGG